MENKFKKVVLSSLIIFLVNRVAIGQKQMVRIAKITVDSTQLLNYNEALKEQMNTAIKREVGVLTYYALSDKKYPNKITILEIYADSAAYKLHIKTNHFLKYKKTVEKMVQSLELIDVNLIGSANKITN